MWDLTLNECVGDTSVCQNLTVRLGYQYVLCFCIKGICDSFVLVIWLSSQCLQIVPCMSAPALSPVPCPLSPVPSCLLTRCLSFCSSDWCSSFCSSCDSCGALCILHAVSVLLVSPQCLTVSHFFMLYRVYLPWQHFVFRVYFLRSVSCLHSINHETATPNYS